MADNPSSVPHDETAGAPHDSNEQTVSIPRVEALLHTGTIVAMRGTALWGSNYAALVIVSDPDLQTTAVYKPQRGERPLWDFPDGTLCYREVVTYLVSEAIGWHLVPPTVLREDGPHGRGSLQLFIEHDPEINYFSLDDRFVDQLQRFAVFDYVVNNTDRKGGHLLMDARGKLWGIDHGLTFHTLPKLRTVIWEFTGQPVPDPVLNDIHSLCEHLDSEDTALRHAIGDMLTLAEINAMRRRIQKLLDAKRFPRPGPGPNHPWPPV